MKKALIALIFSMFLINPLQAFELTVDQNDTGSIAISTNPATPTQILSNNLAIMRTWIINPGTTTVFLVGVSSLSASGNTPATFSISLTTGSFYLLGSSGTITFTPDGYNDPFRGAMWAATSGATTGTSLLRFRAK